MKGNILLFCFLLCILYQVPAQESNEQVDTDQIEIVPVPSDNNSETGTEQSPKKFDFGMTIGTGFTFSPGNFYGPSYSVAPGFSYRITPRLFLSAGLMLEHAVFYPLYGETDNQDKILPMTRAFLYTSGSYLLSNRLTIQGMVYKSLNDIPLLNTYNSSYNYQGMGVGFNYKISRSISVGVHMQVQQNSGYPYYNLMPPAGFIP